MSSKAALRQHYLSLRNKFSSEYKQQASALVSSKVLALPIINRASNICSFISLDSEINTQPLIQELLSQHKYLSAPVIENDQVILRHVTSLESCLPGRLNILEPPASEPVVDPQSVDVFIVPGLSFDVSGYRLGYGKGFYDRLLSATKGFKLGIGFTDQIAFALPHDQHDIRLHQILTDTVSYNSFPFVEKSLS